MICQRLKEDGLNVSVSKICQWFAVPHRTVCYKPIKSAPKVQAGSAEPVKAMIAASLRNLAARQPRHRRLD
jgi:putative transposase